MKKPGDGHAGKQRENVHLDNSSNQSPSSHTARKVDVLRWSNQPEPSQAGELPLTPLAAIEKNERNTRLDPVRSEYDVVRQQSQDARREETQKQAEPTSLRKRLRAWFSPSSNKPFQEREIFLTATEKGKEFIDKQIEPYNPQQIARIEMAIQQRYSGSVHRWIRKPSDTTQIYPGANDQDFFDVHTYNRNDAVRPLYISSVNPQAGMILITQADRHKELRQAKPGETGDIVHASDMIVFHYKKAFAEARKHGTVQRKYGDIREIRQIYVQNEGARQLRPLLKDRKPAYYAPDTPEYAALFQTPVAKSVRYALTQYEPEIGKKKITGIELKKGLFGFQYIKFNIAPEDATSQPQ